MTLRRRKRREVDPVERQVALVRHLPPDGLARWIRFYRSDSNDALDKESRHRIAERLVRIRAGKIAREKAVAGRTP